MLLLKFWRYSKIGTALYSFWLIQLTNDESKVSSTALPDCLLTITNDAVLFKLVIISSLS
jgi:hypothetical protein